MFIVRRTMLAMPGRRDELVQAVRALYAVIEQEGGAAGARVLTGSIGASDSIVETEITVRSLAELEEQLARANASPEVAKMGATQRELVVPGSMRFEIFRLQQG